MDNLEEMDEFLEKYNLAKLNQKEIEDLNRPITSMGMETVIKIFQKTKAQDQMASQVNSTQKFREELISILLKLFQKTAKEVKLPNLFYEATITLIPKLAKDATQKENCRAVSLMNIDAKFSTKF